MKCPKCAEELEKYSEQTIFNKGPGPGSVAQEYYCIRCNEYYLWEKGKRIKLKHEEE